MMHMAGSSPDRTPSCPCLIEARLLEAFGKMDFIVTMDIILNDTAWFSDVILPEASYLERYDPLVPVGNKAFIRQPVIEPQGEAKSALWIYKQLGERLGLGDYFQYADEEDYIRQQLAPLGVSLEEVKAKGYAEMPEGESAGDHMEYSQWQDRTLLGHACQSWFPGLSQPGRNLHNLQKINSTY